MKRKLFLLFASFFLGYSVHSIAQESLHISIDEAKEHALNYNKTIQKANLAIQKADYAKWQSISSMLPKVEASFSYNNYLGHKMTLMGMPIAMNPEGSFTAQAVLAFSGMQVVGVQLSEIARQMSQTSALQDDLSLQTNVTNAYYAILVAEESKKIVEGNLENLRKLYNSSLNLVKVGMAEQTDADQLEVQVGMLENTIRMAERNVELSYNTLRLLLGVNTDTAITLKNSLMDFTSKESVNELLLTSFDITQNFTVQLLNQAIDVSQKQVELNHWAYAPMLSGFYQYTKKTHFDKAAGFDMTPPNLVGVTISIPVFSSGERYAKVKQAQFDLQTAKLNKEQTVDALLMEEKQLRYNLTSAIESYELQLKNVALYERILTNATQKYEQGMISSTELSTISNNTLSTQSQYISALMDMLMAKTKLQQLINKL
ncbi:MAG: TolC family protein [Bacteroidales bacterium]|nr:TolC family protein [Bacteroidales bacterium]